MNLRRVLIVNPFGLGDVLFTTPVIKSLSRAVSGIKIGYLCNSRSAEILKDNPLVDHVFIYDRDEFESLRKRSFFAWLKKGMGLIAGIKEKRFDVALDFSLNSQYGFLCWMAGIKKRVGFDYKGRGVYLTDRIKFSGYSYKHVVEYYGDLLRYLGIGLEDTRPALYVNPKDLSRVEYLLAQEGVSGNDLLIGVIPGAGMSWGKDAYLKHWPVNNFASLADKLIENYQAKIIIMGDLKEAQIARDLISGMRHKALDFSGRTSVGELSALISKMRVVIANDGGPLHMANALGVKTVSLFGPVDDKVYGPYPPDQRNAVVKKEIDCRPCYNDFHYPVCDKGHKCLEEISVDEVYNQARRLI